jgi:PAT family beta-lactamase induction signal transducer AmpG
MRDFAVNSFRSFVGSRGAFVGLLVALLPAGAMGLGLALQSNLAVELGMNDDEVAWLNVWSTVINGGFCVLGGYLSDHLGRRRTLAIYIAAMSLPVLYLMNELNRYGWVMPVEMTGANRPVVPPALLMAFWIAALVYNAFNGLMYGTRAANFMDVTNPAVAATQFTAYMAMMNLAIAFAATWQGVAIEAWGYPTTLLIDAIVGPLCVLLLPALKQVVNFRDERAAARARITAIALGVCVLLFVPLWPNRAMFGEGQSIVGTFFTLVFVASALFLLAGREVLGSHAGVLRRLAPWMALLLFAMYGRYWVDRIDNGALHAIATALLYATPIAGGLILLAMARIPWRDRLTGEDAPAPA